VKYEEIVELMNNDPYVQKLLQAPIPARLAYIAPDGSPRVVPVSYLWNGQAFVFASPPDWPKIKALTVNPKVALTVDTTDFPPNILLVRGEATIEFDKGLPDEYVEASRRIVGEERMAEWEAGVRAENRNMALVSIKPTWIKIMDFDTRFPTGR
jgi:nitroimidazol reductase NimA-like FMN-containing flavoprotein (pyridoxamine 5'-phosphate oxidase superfamily)